MLFEASTTWLPAILLSISDESRKMASQRSTPAQLRRAAGSFSLQKLQAALQGWTAEEIDNMPDGKNAVHMAAWQGSLENLQYLTKHLGCDINGISTGEYSYGKTPIFFAATRARNEVVEYLLDAGAMVKIINNKGQSVRSIASSHLSETVVARITQQEQLQSHLEWRNYRTTHSDGLEYGDLEPRFLERPIRPSDEVTPYAVNPTTKESRKGSFLKRNPHFRTRHPSRKQTNARKSRPRPRLSVAEIERLEMAWNLLFEQLQSPQPQEQQARDALLTIVELSDKKRELWIPAAAKRLSAMPDPTVFETFMTSLTALTDRESCLLDKLVAHIKGEAAAKPSDNRRRSMERRQIMTPEKIIESEQWKKAITAIPKKSFKACFENGGTILSLRQDPIWVSTEEALVSLDRDICGQSVIGLDSEWYDDENESARISTLQLAMSSADEPRAWVIDLLNPNEVYQARARAFVAKLFSGKFLILGFAIGHDLPKVSEWLQSSLSRDSCLDLQALFGYNTGLAACCRKFSTRPLSKKEQCSNWGRRPLEKSQLSYAGLDAAVLPVMLSEIARQLVGDGIAEY